MMPAADEESIVNAVVEAVRERIVAGLPALGAFHTAEMPRLVGQIAGAAIKAMRDVGADDIYDIDHAFDTLGVPWCEPADVYMSRAERVRWAARRGAIRLNNRDRMVKERAGEALREMFEAVQRGDIEDLHYSETEGECPEDDTCTCAGRAVFLKLQHALEMIEGKREP